MRIRRGWLLWAAASCLLAALPPQLAPELALLTSALDPASTLDLVALVRGLAAVLLLGCGLWWWAATTAVLVAAGRGRRARPRGCPRWVHRAVLGALGAALTGGLATPALAFDGSGAPSDPVTVVRGLPYPDRAEGGVSRPVLARTATPTRPQHLVVPGDTLWAIAARDLSPDASPADITDRWQQIYRLNRAAVGPDPDLLVPGTSLELPSPREETR